MLASTFLAQAFGLLPPRLAIRMGRWAGRRFLKHFLRAHIMGENLRVVTGKLDPDLLNNVAENIGGLAASLPHLGNILHDRRGASLILRGVETLPPGAAIFVGAHVKNWEVDALALAKAGRPALIVYSAPRRKWVDDILQRLRQNASSDLAFVEKNKALRACITHLQSGGNLCLIVDQRTESGHYVTFFGKSARFTHLPARLALRFNCPIIPLQGEGDDARAQYVIRFMQPILPQGKTEQEITQEMATAIEGMIAKDPGEWFCNKYRWPKVENK